MSDYEYNRLKELGFHAEAEEYRRMSGMQKPQPKPKICGGVRPKLKPHPTTILHALAKEKSIVIKPGMKAAAVVKAIKGCGKTPSRKAAQRWLLDQAASRPDMFERANPSPSKTKTKSKPKVKSSVSSKSFLASAEWRRLRYDALKKYGAKCQLCGATPQDGARMNVDHIKPRAKYPELALDINNLQILCGSCNQGKGNRDETDWR